ncbi:unnamed protein product [Adineta steineri]|uniref:Uncharacterized protein n=1 Tax=Adineta steineri TaxID=433720 RepID=A0A815L436_9BILA|nr:unnamed protein product [Adineta steineri]CAF1402585.1 unnamed protein product [Adineta steineri]
MFFDLFAGSSLRKQSPKSPWECSSLLNYLNSFNNTIDGYGRPTLAYFIEQGIVSAADQLICHVYNTPLNCTIEYNLHLLTGLPLYTLQWDTIKDENVTQFVYKLIKRFNNSSDGIYHPWHYFYVRNGDQMNLEQKFQKLNFVFRKTFVAFLLRLKGIWQILPYFCQHDRRLKYKCLSEETCEALIATYNMDTNLKHLLNHRDIEIEYKSKTEDNEILAEVFAVNDIKFGSGIWNTNINCASSIGNVITAS